MNLVDRVLLERQIRQGRENEQGERLESWRKWAKPENAWHATPTDIKKRTTKQ
jgi:hypothetical protein